MPSVLGCWLSWRWPTATRSSALDRFGDVDLRATGARGDGAEQRRAGGARGRVRGGRGRVRRRVREPPRPRGAAGRGPGVARNAGRSLAPVRDPWAVAAAASAAGARAPETRSVRRAAGGGRRAARGMAAEAARGVGVGVGSARGPVGAWRRRRSSSAGSTDCRARRRPIGDGRRAVVLGLTEQLHRRPGFGWMGNVTPPRLPDGEVAELDGQLRAVCDEVAARFGVRGAFGVDAMWDGRHAWVLEVNPRPPGSLELFGPGCFDAHVRGARGLAFRPPARPRRRGVRR